ncbi:Ig-like domain-containing protein [Clostridium sp. BL-8]|uniref:Ig-like domain-containing protein n=1 Tax=Clostridium sp. BL-8 TaxID=349938 RepID=UPI00098C2172|nr:Ig-like domain-containing protein [Clostridium sp. BL-8]OOM70734.1 bacterial Ig-like domain protein [Clostridium sp. BL-8]
MNKYFKKFGIMFVMTLILSLGFCISAFADDGGVIGTSNLNNTAANSAKVGYQLKLPEVGWKRYDDSDSRIKYGGSGWSKYNSSARYGGAETYTTTLNDYCGFKFYGTKLRIISIMNNDTSFSIDVNIDGVMYNYHQSNALLVSEALVFEIDGLSSAVHEITITNRVNNAHFNIDAIDIDADGYLVDSNESISLDKASMDLTTGDSEQLTATTTPAAVGVTWTSSDPSVATVDSTGKVTTVGAGTATITATTTDGSNLSASCTVKVIANNSGNNGGTTTGASAIVNIAYAKGDNTNNAGGDVSIIFNGVPDTTLSAVKTASVKSVWLGDTFTYTIVVTNTGSKTAKAVVINDSAPNHIQFMPSGITTTQGIVDSSSSASNIVVNVGDIPPAGTVAITVPATVVL